MPDLDPGTAGTRTSESVLTAAGAAAGVQTSGAVLIRDGVNALYRLPGDVVARVGPPGSHATARHSVQASRWLAEAGIPVVRALEGVDQPTLVGDRAVTWWARLPRHRHATPAELGGVLARLHALPLPDSPVLPPVDPFDGLDILIDNATVLSEHDRTWLHQTIRRLRADYTALAPGLNRCVIHGDAWQGNVAVPEHGGDPVLLDLDHVGTGPPEWDLVSLAVDHTDFARINQSDYQDFVHAYGGYDTTTHPGYRTLATTRELRWYTFALSKASTDSTAAEQARHRLACLRGEINRPWTWPTM